MDSFKKFSDDKLAAPFIIYTDFESVLKDECISEKDFLKLMINSVYVKTMGDLS